MPGTGTFPIEVSHVSRHGFWILAGEEELLLPFEHFPWFRQASIEQIMSVDRPTENHLHWPLLDIDLSLDSIRDPAAFPLVAKTPS
ncbi:MAG: DUF2442 domain-containing protein [Planctomycetaceae bacterium]